MILSFLDEFPYIISLPGHPGEVRKVSCINPNP